MKIVILISFFCITTFANKSDKTNKFSDTFPQSVKTEQKDIVLNKFTEIAKEIDGCSCSFYLTEKDKKEGKYICVNDFANLTFISINDKLEKFELLKHEDNSDIYFYKNGSYDLKIEIIEKKPEGYEISKIKGIISVKTKAGRELINSILGICGC